MLSTYLSSVIKPSHPSFNRHINYNIESKLFFNKNRKNKDNFLQFAVGRSPIYPGFPAWPYKRKPGRRMIINPITEKDEISNLKSKITKLEKMVENQQKLLEYQVDEISELKNSIRSTNGHFKDNNNNNTCLLDTSLHKKSDIAFAISKSGLTPYETQAYVPDQRFSGIFDARFHSTLTNAIPKDMRVLPDRIVLVRHAESEGNTNKHIYSVVPDQKLSLTSRGWSQAEEVGKNLRHLFKKDNKDFKVFFILSPYRRSFQTFEGICKAFEQDEILGSYEEVQLREQDFGNFQDPLNKKKEMAERLEFGRFFYRFPNGESGADVYDRITIFEDHLVRDINAGRYSQGNTNVVLITHGLSLRIILMRWFHWTVDQFLNVYNPDNCEPIILERIVPSATGIHNCIHTKMLYHISNESTLKLRGATEDMTRPKPPFDNLLLYNQ